MRSRLLIFIMLKVVRSIRIKRIVKASRNILIIDKNIQLLKKVQSELKLIVDTSLLQQQLDFLESCKKTYTLYVNKRIMEFVNEIPELSKNTNSINLITQEDLANGYLLLGDKADYALLLSEGMIVKKEFLHYKKEQ